MAKFKCDKCGNIRALSNDAKIKYCPICGKDAIRIWFMPPIYLGKNATFWISTPVILYIIYLVLLMIIGSISRGCADNDLKALREQQRIDAMDPVWHNLYEQISACSGKDDEIIKDFVQINKDYLTTHKNITPYEMKQILDKIDTYNGKVVAAKILATYVSTNSTTQRTR